MDVVVGVAVLEDEVGTGVEVVKRAGAATVGSLDVGTRGTGVKAGEDEGRSTGACEETEGERLRCAGGTGEWDGDEEVAGMVGEWS